MKQPLPRPVTAPHTTSNILVLTYFSARTALLVLYAIFFNFYLSGDQLNLMELLLYTAVLIFVSGGTPKGPFVWTLFVFALCAATFYANRYMRVDEICPACPSFNHDCYSNPYAVADNLTDFTQYETYDSQAFLNRTRHFNPLTSLGEDPIIANDILPQCWYIGCSDCHPRYEVRNWLVRLSLADFAVLIAYGIACIR